MSMGFWNSAFQISEPSVNGKNMTLQTVGELPGGRYVVVWTGTGDAGDGGGGGSWGDGIRARILNADGSWAGEAFVVNTTIEREQGEASIAVLSDGRFVVTWTSNENGDGGAISNDNCIRARVFNADGTPALYDGSTADFVVNTIGGVSQWNPQAIAMDGGGFLIAFTSVVEDDFFGDQQTQGRIFGPNGAGGSSEFSLNETVDTGEQLSSIARLGDGGFVVTWFDPFPATNFGEAANGNNNVARIFNADGSPRTASFLLATTPVLNLSSSALMQPHVSALADGGFVAAWTFPDDGEGGPNGDGSSTSIVARVFEADGTPRTGEFQVNTTTNLDQRMANIVGLADGRFIVSFWSRDDQQGNPADTLLARVFDATGAAEGGDFILNLGPGTSFGATAGSPSDMIQTADGRILAIYNNENATDLFGRFLDPTPAGGAQSGNAGGNTLIGNAGADTLQGFAGDDRLYAGGGDDTAIGGTGRDTIRGGDGRDDLSGEADNDTLAGEEGNDILRGGGGGDRMAGGAGNDRYYVDHAGDVVTEAAGEGTDTVYTSISTSLAANAEILRMLGADNLAGNGNALDNAIHGNSANNRMKGLAGNDTLDGGVGADRMEGGDGDDVYHIDNSGDVVVETGLGTNGGFDTVYSAVSHNLRVNFEALFLTGSADINGKGNAQNNTITGNAGDNLLLGGGGYDSLTGGGGNDTLNGEDGYDTMTGGAGDDTYYVDHGADQTIEKGNGGTDTVISTQNWTLAGAVENLRLTGPATLGTGNGLHNQITGNALNNLLQGLGGGDRLNGGDGADTLDGGRGDDTLAGGAQGDVFRFAATDAGDDIITDFRRSADRFDLSGGSFSAAVVDGGATVLSHDGGTIRVAGVNTLTLDQWNALVLPSGGALGEAPASLRATALWPNEIVHVPNGDWCYA